MRMWYFIFCIGILSQVFVACQKENAFDYQSEIVVEGSIDEGGYPLVMLSRVFPLEDKVQLSTNIEDYIVRWAKVTVSDGEKEEILTGKYDSKYYPPFIYTSYNMRGEAGKTYTLKVEYENKVITAQTTIPRPIPLDAVVVSRCADSDTLYQINARFSDPKNEKNYYKFFTQVLNKEPCYYSSFLGTLDDSALGDQTEMPVYKGTRFTYVGDFTPFYCIEDIVRIKFTQIPKEGFDFWSGYENEVSFSSNFFFPFLRSLPSNIKGGKGIWCGYGAYVRTISIAQEMRGR